MAARTDGANGDRTNALWGKGERDGARRTALRSRFGLVATLVAALALAAPLTAGAGSFKYVAPTLDTSYLADTTDDSLATDDAAWAEVAWAEAAWADAAWAE